MREGGLGLIGPGGRSGGRFSEGGVLEAGSVPGNAESGRWAGWCVRAQSKSFEEMLAKTGVAATKEVMAQQTRHFQARNPRSTRRTAPPKSGPPKRMLTPRDLAMQAWIARVGAATISQLRRRFSLGRSQAYRRIDALRQHGLLDRHRILADQPPAYAPPGKTVSPASFTHMVAVTDLVIDLELDRREIVAEIEIRRCRFGMGGLGERLADGQVEAMRSCKRVPDAVEIRGGQLIAYEIELSSKGRSRREEILSIYATSSYAEVVWLVPSARLRSLIAEEVRGSGLEGFMRVQAENALEPAERMAPR